MHSALHIRMGIPMTRNDCSVKQRLLERLHGRWSHSFRQLRRQRLRKLGPRCRPPKQLCRSCLLRSCPDLRCSCLLGSRLRCSYALRREQRLRPSDLLCPDLLSLLTIECCSTHSNWNCMNEINIMLNQRPAIQIFTP